MPNARHQFAWRMPKVELHVHLEGSISPATLLKLARKNDSDLPVMDEAGLQAFYRFRDFGHFLTVYRTVIGCLRTPDDYRLIAHEFGAACAAQNIRYAEVTFSIVSNVQHSGLPWRDILAGLNAGRAEARAQYGVDWGWIFDIVRDDPDTQDQVVDIALAARDQGVVALGLAGDERASRLPLFAHNFQRAAAAGLPIVPHTGELNGPEHIWETVWLTHPHRLEHGVRCIEDPALVAYLRDRRLPLDVCPTSNIRLGVYPDYAAHPLRALWDAGLTITVNSDDPPMFGTDLNGEYGVLVDRFGFDANELEQISLNGVAASLLPEADKVRLAKEFRAGFARLRETLEIG